MLSKQLIANTDNEDLSKFIRQEFINFIPRNLEYIIHINGSEQERYFASHLDCFEYHFRAYVCGKSNRLHRVYYEIRNIPKEEFWEECLDYSIKQVGFIIRKNEIYEYMARYNYAREKCYKLIEKQKTLNK